MTSLELSSTQTEPDSRTGIMFLAGFRQVSIEAHGHLLYPSPHIKIKPGVLTKAL